MHSWNQKPKIFNSFAKPGEKSSFIRAGSQRRARGSSQGKISSSKGRNLRQDIPRVFGRDISNIPDSISRVEQIPLPTNKYGSSKHQFPHPSISSRFQNSSKMAGVSKQKIGSSKGQNLSKGAPSSSVGRM